VVAKPQIVAIRERVTTTGANPPGSVTAGSIDGKRVIGAANPGPEDAADLLRYGYFFYQCQNETCIPK
jgi:hypothetical protein